MKRFGIIGDPIKTAQSPVLFRKAYAGRWPYDLIEGSDFELSWQRFLDGYDGINVTAPFKELAFRKVDHPSEECRIIRATNLVVKSPGGTVCYNSDYRGVRECLLEALPQGSSALVIGCGGAGKAAAAAAASLGMSLSIANRSIVKAESFAAHLQECGFQRPEVLPLDGLQPADIVIYTLPVPVGGLEPGLAGARFLLEANYKNPSFNAQELACKGIKYIPGADWLYRQAVTGYELLTGVKPEL